MKEKTIVINFYGGPGTGKSTMASAVFSELKFLDLNVELVQEFAKDLVWEKRFTTFEDELYVFAKQSHRIQRLNGKVKVILTDSPLLMKLIYIEPNDKAFKDLVLKEFDKYDNVNIFLKRCKKYNPEGRYQTEEEAKAKDKSIKDVLDVTNHDYLEFDSVKDSVEKIVKLILEKIKEIGE